METTDTTYKGINIVPFVQRQRALREETIKDIMLLKDQGLTYQQVGDLMGMTRTAVHNFVKGYNL